jgi:hypothetical protein
MRKTILLVFLFSLVSARGMAKGNQFTVEVKDAKGTDVGTVRIKSVASGVEIKLNLRGLPPCPVDSRMAMIPPAHEKFGSLTLRRLFQRRFRIPRDRPQCGCTCGGVGVPERLKTDGQDASVA